jgi:hypothetical protein
MTLPSHQQTRQLSSPNAGSRVMMKAADGCHNPKEPPTFSYG